jgi:hypothetical protein
VLLCCHERVASLAPAALFFGRRSTTMRQLKVRSTFAAAFIRTRPAVHWFFVPSAGAEGPTLKAGSRPPRRSAGKC